MRPGAQLGGIDIWFANAGIDGSRGLDAPEEDWAATRDGPGLGHDTCVDVEDARRCAG